MRPGGQEVPTLPEDCAALYRPRRPQESPLYRLVDACYDEVKGRWEEDFEQRYGFWRGSVENAAYGVLDCGSFDSGFARVRCTECRTEYLVAFSCQRRGFCPSCAAKRGALKQWGMGEARGRSRDPEYLFDRCRAPEETSNRAGQPSLEAHWLRGRLLEWLARAGDEAGAEVALSPDEEKALEVLGYVR